MIIRTVTSAMARKNKALNHSWKKNIGNVYEKVGNVQQHRDHRSKKNQMKGGYKRRQERVMYKKKLLDLSTPPIDIDL